MKKRITLSIILVVLSTGLAVFEYFILPNEVVIQFSIGSSGNSTAPKLLAILVPTALGIGGAFASLLSKDEGNSFGKSLLVSALGIGLGIFMIVVNSFMK